MSNLDYRAKTEELPLFPRFLRNPQQTPRLPSKLIPIAFLLTAAIFFFAAISYVLMQKRSSGFNPKKIFIVIFCVCILGNINDFFYAKYDIARNAGWSTMALLSSLIFLK